MSAPTNPYGYTDALSPQWCARCSSLTEPECMGAEDADLCAGCERAEAEEEAAREAATAEAAAREWQATLEALAQARTLLESSIRLWQCYALSERQVAARARELCAVVEKVERLAVGRGGCEGGGQ